LFYSIPANAWISSGLIDKNHTKPVHTESPLRGAFCDWFRAAPRNPKYKNQKRLTGGYAHFVITTTFTNYGWSLWASRPCRFAVAKASLDAQNARPKGGSYHLVFDFWFGF